MAAAESLAVTPAFLASSLAAITEAQNNTAIMGALGDIKASVPFNEGQSQLAMAHNTASILGTMNTNAMADALATNLTNKAIADNTATVIASNGIVKDAVFSTSASELTAILNSKFELASTIRDDGDKTRALIIAQNDATLNRELAVAQAALLEQRAITRGRETEINITNTNTAVAAQSQVQAQQQQQFQILSNLAATVGALVQQNQTIHQGIVNLGTMSGSAGQQTAANTRVN